MGAMGMCLIVLAVLAPISDWLLTGTFMPAKCLFAGILGVGMMAAYYGTVKPLVLEMVPSCRVGIAVGYSVLMEGTAAVFVTPVLIGLLAEGVFGYTPPVGNQGQLAWTGAGTGVPHE